MGSGAVASSWYVYNSSGWRQVESEVIEEALVTIYVNGVELATIMSTPLELDRLAVGFMKNEGVIESLQEVSILHVSQPGCCVDVWLDHAFEKPQREIITSGCGGGVTFTDPTMGLEPVGEGNFMEPERLVEIFNQLHTPDSLYARARGVHAAGITDGEKLLIWAEDVGRHNTIDKVMGACLLERVDPQGKILLATGRISSEMLKKSVVMGCPIVASRNSPTSMSVAMAEALNVTLVGYVRRGSMRVYTHPERMGLKEPALVPIG